MTSPHEDIAKLVPAAQLQPPHAPRPYQVLPHVGIGDLTGFVERLHVLGSREDLYKFARDLHMEADDLLPLVEAADLLEFADIHEGDVLLTESGRQFGGGRSRGEGAVSAGGRGGYRPHPRDPECADGGARRTRFRGSYS